MSSAPFAAVLVAAACAASAGCFLKPQHDDAASSNAAIDGLPPGCQTDDPSVVPSDLRCTGLYTDVAAKIVAPNARAYSPAQPFWSDGAEKARWVMLPAGQLIDSSNIDDWVYPVGTKAWKELSVGGHRVETRFWWKQSDTHWVSAVYVWSADESSAMRSDGGDITLPDGSGYHVPTNDECSDCHKGRKDRLLGFEAISLALPGATGLTLDELVQEGLLDTPPSRTTLSIQDDGTGKAAPALTWLHVNCGISCHNGNSTSSAYPTGLAMRLAFDQVAREKPNKTWDIYASLFGVGAKTPAWYGDTRLVPGDPTDSLMFQLLSTRGKDQQMPPIATNVVDPQGVGWVGDWISAMGPHFGARTSKEDAPSVYHGLPGVSESRLGL